MGKLDGKIIGQDAANRKLLFGARKGVTQTVGTWFIAHSENNLGVSQQ